MKILLEAMHNNDKYRMNQKLSVLLYFFFSPPPSSLHCFFFVIVISFVVFLIDKRQGTLMRCLLSLIWLHLAVSAMSASIHECFRSKISNIIFHTQFCRLIPIFKTLQHCTIIINKIHLAMLQHLASVSRNFWFLYWFFFCYFKGWIWERRYNHQQHDFSSLNTWPIKTNLW